MSEKMDHLRVVWEFMGNVADQQRVTEGQFLLYNMGSKTITLKDFTLYFNQVNIRPVQEIADTLGRVEHINGDFYRMVPNQPLVIEPGDTLRVKHTSYGWMLKERDAPAGLYMVFNEGTPNEEIAVIENYSVVGFDDFNKLNPFRHQGVIDPTPEFFFSKYDSYRFEAKNNRPKIIPTPLVASMLTGSFTVSKNTSIVYEQELEGEAIYLSNFFLQHFGVRLHTAEGDEPLPNAINLLFGEIQITESNPKEAYSLTISPEGGVHIVGAGAPGVFYGIQSLLALISVDAYRDKLTSIELPAIKINDAPRFAYRGLHLDVARNFQQPQAVKKLIDLMATYKMNALHLHLTEDEGWRIEIDGMPELTDIGAKRGHTLTSEEWLPPSFGSGPLPNAEGNAGTGYYTREEYIDIVRYAKQRHIEVIPEINFPGHARAAIAAMEARYQYYTEQGNRDEAERYRLIDPDDQSVYLSAQLFTDNVVCVARESVYDFYEHVVSDLVRMHNNAGAPLRILHTGGDEVPAGAWEGSPICQALLERKPEIGSFENLQGYFLERLLGVLGEYNITLAGWEEVAQIRNAHGAKVPNPNFSEQGVIPYVWDNTYGNIDLGFRLANAGYKVIMCNVTNFYFDLAYDANPFEPGLYWAGFVNARSAYGYVPYRVVPPIPREDFGKLINPARDISGAVAINPMMRGNIKGIQGQLWSETIKGPDMLERAVLPKLIGLAERAWGAAPHWEGIDNHSERFAATNASWDTFATQIGLYEFTRLDHLHGGFSYRIAAPGAKIVDGVLHANSNYPGFTIRYTTDGTEPTTNSEVYTQPTMVNGRVKLRAFSSLGRGGMVAEVE